MQSDFDTVCKNARERVIVPPVPLAAIRSGALFAAAARPKRRWTSSMVTMVASVSILAAAAGAAAWNGTHVWFNPAGMFAIRAQKMNALRNPTFANLPSFVRHTDFPIILPSGLPEGTTIAAARTFGSSAVMLQYNLPGAWRRSDHLLGIVLANPKAVGGPEKLPGYYRMDVGRKGPGGQQWVIGGETVLVMSSTITAAELARVRSAMVAQSQRQH